MKSKTLGVTSKFFSVYQAFKTEAESRGVVWHESFNAFEKGKMNRTGIYISKDWHKIKDGKVMMSFSNFAENIVDLDTNFEGAIEKLTELISTKEMTLEEIEKELGYKILIVNS